MQTEEGQVPVGCNGGRGLIRQGSTFPFELKTKGAPEHVDGRGGILIYAREWVMGPLQTTIHGMG